MAVNIVAVMKDPYEVKKLVNANKPKKRTARSYSKMKPCVAREEERYQKNKERLQLCKERLVKFLQVGAFKNMANP